MIIAKSSQDLSFANRTTNVESTLTRKHQIQQDQGWFSIDNCRYYIISVIYRINLVTILGQIVIQQMNNILVILNKSKSFACSTPNPQCLNLQRHDELYVLQPDKSHLQQYWLHYPQFVPMIEKPIKGPISHG